LMKKLLVVVAAVLGIAAPARATSIGLPLAQYAADAFAGSYALPPCGLTCASLTIPGTVINSEDEGGGLISSMARASMTGSPIPMVSVDANAGGAFGDAAVAGASIVYYMEIVGGTGTPTVTLDVNASGFASASGGDANAGGALEIQDPLNNIVEQWTTCANTTPSTSCGGVPTSFTLVGVPLALSANTIYAVKIGATGSVGQCFLVQCPLQIGDAQAFTDPWFMIDPLTPLGVYSLEFSAGIGNTPGSPAPAPVPEPASLMLLGTGIVTLVGRRLRRSRSK
jgi:hypothetical protein